MQVTAAPDIAVPDFAVQGVPPIGCDAPAFCIEPGSGQLFQGIVVYFKTIITFPQEATDGISDEQYIRNLVDALYRPKTSDK